MIELHEKIIVFKAYDTVVEANLAKTKLDAYGFPCFLTDEHFVNLYPIRNDLFHGVRLHIFEKDLTEVESLLESVRDTEKHPVCPHCQSYSWEPVSAFRKIYNSILILLDVDSTAKEYNCKNCGNFF